MRFGITKLFSRVGSSNRTYTCASTAFYASVCVDYVLSITFADAATGAFCLASTTADAIIINNISHCLHLFYIECYFHCSIKIVNFNSFFCFSAFFT